MQIELWVFSSHKLPILYMAKGRWHQPGEGHWEAHQGLRGKSEELGFGRCGLEGIKALRFLW